MNRRKNKVSELFFAISQDLSQQYNNYNTVIKVQEWSVGKWDVDTQSYMGISV